ncbi:hypothetical protein EBT25_09415 [bacterium]|nr:hypothetical protein [bacterium]
MSLNTAMNAIGTVAGIASLLSGGGGGSGGQLNKFMAEMRQNGVARTNLFDVRIGIPLSMKGKDSVADKIELYAQSASLPGRSIETQELARATYGPREKFPYSMQYQDLNLTFIADGKGEIYKYFYNWMQSIVRGDQETWKVGFVDSNKKKPYQVNYKDQYAVPIEITTYDEQGEARLKYRLIDCWPNQMPDVSLSWAEQSSMMQFSVNFCYTLARLEGADEGVKVGLGGISGLSTLQKLVKIGTAVQTIASLKRPTSVQSAIVSATSIKNIASGF